MFGTNKKDMVEIIPKLCEMKGVSLIEGKDITGQHITAHKLRATYGTALYHATGVLGLVQDALGHASPTTTKKYYVDSKEENMKKAAKVEKY